LKHLQKGAVYASPFWLDGLSEYDMRQTPGISSGLAIISILWAIDWINLGTMPYKRIIADGLGLKLK
jgi:hypothetical protein